MRSQRGIVRISDARAMLLCTERRSVARAVPVFDAALALSPPSAPDGRAEAPQTPASVEPTPVQFRRVPVGEFSDTLRKHGWSSMHRIDVVAAAILDGSKVFAGQKAAGPLQGLWEFPGGKVEAGEKHTDALRRELMEELGCDIRVADHVFSVDHDYDFIQIRLHTYWCRLRDTMPTVREHANATWADGDELARLQWAPADLPVVSIVSARLRALTGSHS